MPAAIENSCFVMDVAAARFPARAAAPPSGAPRAPLVLLLLLSLGAAPGAPLLVRALTLAGTLLLLVLAFPAALHARAQTAGRLCAWAGAGSGGAGGPARANRAGPSVCSAFNGRALSLRALLLSLIPLAAAAAAAPRGLQASLLGLQRHATSECSDDATYGVFQLAAEAACTRGSGASGLQDVYFFSTSSGPGIYTLHVSDYPNCTYSLPFQGWGASGACIQLTTYGSPVFAKQLGAVSSSATASATSTATVSGTACFTRSAASTGSRTANGTFTSTLTVTATRTGTESSSATATGTATRTGTESSSVTATGTAFSLSATGSASATASDSQSAWTLTATATRPLGLQAPLFGLQRHELSNCSDPAKYAVLHLAALAACTAGSSSSGLQDVYFSSDSSPSAYTLHVWDDSGCTYESNFAPSLPAGGVQGWGTSDACIQVASGPPLYAKLLGAVSSSATASATGTATASGTSSITNSASTTASAGTLSAIASASATATGSKSAWTLTATATRPGTASSTASAATATGSKSAWTLTATATRPRGLQAPLFGLERHSASDCSDTATYGVFHLAAVAGCTQGSSGLEDVYFSSSSSGSGAYTLYVSDYSDCSNSRPFQGWGTSGACIQLNSGYVNPLFARLLGAVSATATASATGTATVSGTASRTNSASTTASAGTLSAFATVSAMATFSKSAWTLTATATSSGTASSTATASATATSSATSSASASAVNVVIPGGACGGPSGSLTAPATWMSHLGAGVSSYGNSWLCAPSTFAAPAGSFVTFTLTYASAQTCCDKVYVYDGASTGGYQLGALTSAGQSVTSSTNYLTVQFISDSSVVGFGYQGAVTFGASSAAPFASASASPTPSGSSGGSFVCPANSSTTLDAINALSGQPAYGASYGPMPSHYPPSASYGAPPSYMPSSTFVSHPSYTPPPPGNVQQRISVIGVYRDAACSQYIPPGHGPQADVNAAVGIGCNPIESVGGSIYVALSPAGRYAVTGYPNSTSCSGSSAFWPSVAIGECTATPDGTIVSYPSSTGKAYVLLSTVLAIHGVYSGGNGCVGTSLAAPAMAVAGAASKGGVCTSQPSSGSAMVTHVATATFSVAVYETQSCLGVPAATFGALSGTAGCAYDAPSLLSIQYSPLFIQYSDLTLSGASFSPSPSPSYAPSTLPGRQLQPLFDGILPILPGAWPPSSQLPRSAFGGSVLNAWPPFGGRQLQGAGESYAPSPTASPSFIPTGGYTVSQLYSNSNCSLLYGTAVFYTALMGGATCESVASPLGVCTLFSGGGGTPATYQIVTSCIPDGAIPVETTGGLWQTLWYSSVCTGPPIFSVYEPTNACNAIGGGFFSRYVCTVGSGMQGWIYRNPACIGSVDFVNDIGAALAQQGFAWNSCRQNTTFSTSFTCAGVQETPLPPSSNNGGPGASYTPSPSVGLPSGTPPPGSSYVPSYSPMPTFAPSALPSLASCHSGSSRDGTRLVSVPDFAPTGARLVACGAITVTCGRNHTPACQVGPGAYLAENYKIRRYFAVAECVIMCWLPSPYLPYPPPPCSPLDLTSHPPPLQTRTSPQPFLAGKLFELYYRLRAERPPPVPLPQLQRAGRGRVRIPRQGRLQLCGPRRRLRWPQRLADGARHVGVARGRGRVQLRQRLVLPSIHLCRARGQRGHLHAYVRLRASVLRVRV